MTKATRKPVSGVVWTSALAALTVWDVTLGWTAFAAVMGFMTGVRFCITITEWLDR